MPPTSRHVTELSREECWDFVASATYGRIVYTERALPAVWPVTFSRMGDMLLFEVDRNGTLARASRGSVLAFHIDSVSADDGSACTVTMTGHARHIIGDAADRFTLATSRITVALVPQLITGYRAHLRIPPHARTITAGRL